MSDSSQPPPIYLSRLLLTPESRQVRSELAQPYEMHRTLMHAFDGQIPSGQCNPREKAGMLFRVDVDERNHRIIVYVQSLIEPDWSFLRGLPDYLFDGSDQPGASYKDISIAYARLQNGQTLSFRLRANPTKRIGKSAGDQPGLKGKRIGLVREQDQIAWLERKGRNGGFVLLKAGSIETSDETQCPYSVTVRTEGKQAGRKREGSHAYKTTHLSVVFEGLLQITDASVFGKTLVRGIGSAKAYGFGLLSIAPPGTS